MPLILYLHNGVRTEHYAEGTHETHRRKKWNRSLMSKKAFFPEKKACRAREMSWLDEYSESTVKDALILRK